MLASYIVKSLKTAGYSHYSIDKIETYVRIARGVTFIVTVLQSASSVKVQVES